MVRNDVEPEGEKMLSNAGAGRGPKIRRSYGVIAAAVLAGAAPSECGTPSTPVLTIECSPVNDFGYIANASGNLTYGSRLANGSFTVSGTLTMNTRLFGNPDNVRSVSVAGTIDPYGSSMFAEVISGAPDLVSIYATFDGNIESHVQGDNPQYQTRCGASTVRLPRVADLKLETTMRTVAGGKVQIDVTNIGTVPITAASIQMRINSANAVGTLYAKPGHPSAPANTLNPGYPGYIELTPPVAIARCETHTVWLDVNRSVQSGSYDPFINDSGSVSTPCLRWGTVITADTLGATPDPLIAFKTINQIVNSQVIARTDGNRCNACHNAGSSFAYRPGAGTITPSTTINGYTWATPGGWASQFQAESIKPAYLKNLLQRWQADGAQ